MKGSRVQWGRVQEKFKNQIPPLPPFLKGGWVDLFPESLNSFITDFLGENI